jgi:hypothetical protein
VALEEWREAAKRVLREYRAWQAAERCDRHRLFMAYAAALRCEEQAAHRFAVHSREASGPVRST